MLSLIMHPDKILKFPCEDVYDADPVKEWVDGMVEIMKARNGIGLAANQVGIAKRLFIMQSKGVARVCINPDITKRSLKLAVFIEGCLSYPGKRVRTRRPEKIEVVYQNQQFQRVEECLDGEEAICFQHEYDHLRGKTMYDREFMGRF